jgi:hypothetical protein
MVFNQIDYRFSGYYTYVNSVDFTRFFQQVAEVVSHGTDEVNGHFFVVFVLPDVNVDEFTEAIINEIAHPFFVAVIAQKTHERGQINVWIGFVVNGFKNAFFGEVESFDKAIVDFLGQLLVQEHAE